MSAKLWCHRRCDLGGRLGLSRLIDVIDELGQRVERYELMCSSIDNDIQNPSGSGAAVLQYIERVELGEEDLVDADGNAWVTYITRDKVWFEGLYNQGEGGAVTLAQYKLAVETYLRFLSDPERKPIEVEFPES